MLNCTAAVSSLLAHAFFSVQTPSHPVCALPCSAYTPLLCVHSVTLPCSVYTSSQHAHPATCMPALLRVSCVCNACYSWFETGVIPPLGTYEGYWADPYTLFFIEVIAMQFAELRRWQDYRCGCCCCVQGYCCCCCCHKCSSSAGRSLCPAAVSH